ncbi:MAG: hypothetical protein OEM94_04345 [Acidimicrobiia bacterium]|nr:hypothetical protein [Acidimicrobiia bacterium]
MTMSVGLIRTVETWTTANSIWTIAVIVAVAIAAVTLFRVTGRR